MRLSRYPAITAPPLGPDVGTSPHQWLPSPPRQSPPRRPGRDMTADVRISGFEATDLREWGPSLGRQYQRPLVQRDYTSAVRISGFEAIGV